MGPPASALASRILWFDALVTNVDRTPRNTNPLTWHGGLWLIDHGASLYFHHTWKGWEAASKRLFAAARDHVLLPFAAYIPEAALAPLLTDEVLRGIVDLIPEEWLEGEPAFADAEAVRDAYLEFLSSRLGEPRVWALEEAHG